LNFCPSQNSPSPQTPKNVGFYIYHRGYQGRSLIRSALCFPGISELLLTHGQKKVARLTMLIKILKLNFNLNIEIPFSNDSGADGGGFRLHISFRKPGGGMRSNKANGTPEENSLLGEDV